MGGGIWLGIIVGVILPSLIVGQNLIWPLDNTSYTTEILQSSSVAVSTSQCILSFGSPPPSYTNQVIELDGSSFVDLSVNYSDVTNMDYVFSGMFRPTVSNFVLYHYKANVASQPFRELMLYCNNNKLIMSRLVNGVLETSSMASTSSVLNTWHSVTFGIDKSNGKMIVQLNGTVVISEDNSFIDNVNFVVPGVLRIGGAFNQSRPNFQGRVSYTAFWLNNKQPTSTDLACKTSWIPNIPNCKPAAIDRGNNGAGYFLRQSVIYNSTLKVIASSWKCSQIRCAAQCLRSTGCWYYRFDNTNSTCSECILYDSTVSLWKATGIPDSRIYKWRG